MRILPETNITPIKDIRSLTTPWRLNSLVIWNVKPGSWTNLIRAKSIHILNDCILDDDICIWGCIMDEDEQQCTNGGLRPNKLLPGRLWRKMNLLSTYVQLLNTRRKEQRIIHLFFPLSRKFTQMCIENHWQNKPNIPSDEYWAEHYQRWLLMLVDYYK